MIIPTGAIHDGEEAVREYFRVSRTAFPDQRNELIAVHHSEDAVIVEFDLLGTHAGPFGDIPEPGRSFTCRTLAIFGFDDSGLVYERAPTTC